MGPVEQDLGVDRPDLDLYGAVPVFFLCDDRAM